MDIYARKIISFLRNNMNLDLEIPDIAFHLKLDEQFVQNYLSSLLRQGLVTTKRNEYGRIYWYAIVPLETTPVNKATIEFEPVDSEETSLNPVVKQPEKDDTFDGLIEKKKSVPVKPLISLLITVILVFAGSYITRIQIERKIDLATTTTTRTFVTAKDFTSANENVTAQMNKFTVEIKGLLSTVDSLKGVLVKLQQADSIAKNNQMVVSAKTAVTKKVQKKRK